MSGGWDVASPVDSERVVRRRSLLTSDAPLSSASSRRGRGSSVRSVPRRVDFDQAAAREQRGQGWLVHFTDFDLRQEVSGQLRPLAVEIQGLLADGVRLADRRGVGRLFAEGAAPLELEPLRDVREVARSVRDLRAALVELIAKQPLSVLPDGARDRLSAVVADPGHAAIPEVDEADLYSGAWVDRLVAVVEPLSADLAVVVAAQPAGRVSELDVALSEALSSQIPVGFDQRVAMLRNRLPELRNRRQQALAGRVLAESVAQDRERLRVAADMRRLRL
ncbi:hypothetical protein H7J93_14710 [Mycobacterium barrassiae]|uniref:hypothetical protein n=1 Tax=Mycobacterium barrassiae TaxID=319709 RepID=UPI0022659966|nr:hypothetical protein [Mycobacterium barrassiae]MCV7300875.1 hypothetical protein [Mycobacterium barrassiae]